MTRSIRVAVGQPKYRTPIGHFRIDYVVWNPWWKPPDSDWARHERLTPPGSSNPVGRVKMHVTGLVFLHGSPLENTLGTAASHACVRMSNADAIRLARLLHARAGPAASDTLLDRLVADTALTRALDLSQAVPMDIVYRLAEVRGGDLLLYFDVYRYAGRRVPTTEEQATAALSVVAADTLMIDEARVRALARASRSGTIRASIDSLLKRTTNLLSSP